MVPRLWVPLTDWLWARNWNLAASGACLTASRVAKRVAVSTPFRIESSTLAVVSVVVMMACLPGDALAPVAVLGGWWGCGAGSVPGPGNGLLPVGGVRSGGREQTLAGDRSGGQRRCLL